MEFLSSQLKKTEQIQTMQKTTLALVFLILYCALAQQVIVRKKYASNNQYVLVELLQDNLFHFEYGTGVGPNASQPIYSTPMIFMQRFVGPRYFEEHQVSATLVSLSSADMTMQIDTVSLCVAFFYKRLSYDMTRVCPTQLFQDTKSLSLTKNQVTSIYGLGEQFWTAGKADGDWFSRTRSPGGYFGNNMNEYHGGAVGNAQYPIMYALGSNNYNYAFLLDNVYKQQWGFEQDPFYVNMWGDQIRFYMVSGSSLPELRTQVMQIVGKPLVPPRKVFGFFTGEFNLYYDSNMMFDRIKGIHSAQMPIDGVMLDVQYFGGVIENSADSPMGSLRYADKFLNGRSASAVLSDLQQLGVGVIPIEESYVAGHDVSYGYMAANCMYARQGPFSCDAIYLNADSGDNCWWGSGSYIDWTNEAAGAFWHDNKRQALIDLGLIGHWTDLGEPEIYRGTAFYKGFVIDGIHKDHHGDIHNVYNFLWHKSIYDGYRRNNSTTRTFMVSRSGALGLQRFGAAMWSADIGSNFRSLAAHMNVQMHLSFSGIDYFSADIGGFHRKGLDGDLNILYTRWLANGLWLDFPARAHVENLCNCKQVTPDKVGDPNSNRFNLYQRYALVPYYYSLAYRASFYGEPLLPPMVYYYQNDENTKSNGNQKMIGRDLVIGIVASYEETERNVYLPQGTWYNYHTSECVDSAGAYLNNLPVFLPGNIFTLPAFARAGAIIPKMYVDNGVINVYGHRLDGKLPNNDLILRVYHDPSGAAHSFTLFEDDGYSRANEQGIYAHTEIVYQASTVTISARQGSYAGAPSNRRNIVELALRNQMASSVSINGRSIARISSKEAFDKAQEGYYNAIGSNLVYAKSQNITVSEQTVFSYSFSGQPQRASAYFKCHVQTVPGEEVYAVGDSESLGNWNAQNGVHLEPTHYPVWTKWLQNMNEIDATIAWKCVKKLTNGQYVFADGPNNMLHIQQPQGGYAGLTEGSF